MRKQILDNIHAALASIDLNVSVHEWLDLPYESAELYSIEDVNCKKIDEFESADNIDEINWLMQLSVDIYVQTFGDTATERLQELRSLLLTTIGTNQTWSGLAERTVYTGDTTAYATAENRYGASRVSIDVFYVCPAFAN